MQEYRCNTTRDVVLLSTLCINGTDTSNVDCVPHLNESLLVIFRYIFGIGIILIAIVGIFGNLATLISLPFAVKRKLGGLNRSFKNTTVFILHLSFVDFCWCILVGLPCGYMSLMRHWSFGTFLCKAYAIFAVILTITDQVSLALISISRCLDLTKTEFWRTCCEKKRNLCFIIFLAWLPSLPIVLSYFISSAGIEAGWNCKNGVCSLISSCTTEQCDLTSTLDGLIWYEFVLSVVHLIVMGICYTMIWRKVRKDTTYLKDIGNNSMDLQHRELKMTRTILTLILTHFIFYTPFLLFQGLLFSNLIFQSDLTHGIYFVLMCINHVGFCLNFFIYAASNEQYRNAYLGCSKSFLCQDFWMNTTKIKREETRFENNSLPSRMVLLLRQICKNQPKTYDVQN